MKNEMEACTLLRNSVLSTPGGIAFKVPDPSSDFQSTVSRPFDLFGALFLHPWYCEVKFCKGGLYSFNLATVEDHQIANLLAFQKSVPGAWCWIVYAINVKRGDSRLYVFDNVEEIDRRRTAHENIKQSELKTLPFYAVHKNLIDLSTLN